MTSSIPTILEHPAEGEHDFDIPAQEVRVTFHPPLFLQRRIWILDILRRENVVDVRSMIPPPDIIDLTDRNRSHRY